MLADMRPRGPYPRPASTQRRVANTLSLRLQTVLGARQPHRQARGLWGGRLWGEKPVAGTGPASVTPECDLHEQRGSPAAPYLAGQQSPGRTMLTHSD